MSARKITMGYWYVFRNDSKDKEWIETLIGRVEATAEGWEEIGCDLYPRLHEAGLIPDHDTIYKAEADTGKSIVLGFMHHEHCYRVVYQEDNYDLVYSEWEPEKCARAYDDTEPVGWQCMGDNTGCIYNDGNNTCTHPGCHPEPLGE